ncbi:MAG TPA: hypothetical protein VNA14_11165, partial [Mycobacteriales bacterium]|nr:hypothetical protein [Mycobacteriales bacterium]
MTSTAAAGGRALAAPLVAGMCAAGILLGWASSVAPRLALVAAVAFAGLAAVTRHPAALAVAAVPGALAARRLDLALVDLTYSDALVAAAGMCALPVIASRRLRHGAQPVLWALAGYLACLAASLAVNPSARGALEWLHRLALVGGSLAIGIVLVHTGLHRRALRLLVVAAVVVAAAAIQYSASYGWAAAYPLGFHKNFIGSIFATVLVVLLVSPESVSLPPAAWRAAVIVVGMGLLAAQSRGGMLAVGIAVAVWFVRSRR